MPWHRYAHSRQSGAPASPPARCWLCPQLNTRTCPLHLHLPLKPPHNSVSVAQRPPPRHPPAPQADETLELMSTELGNTRRLGESVSAALLYGVDKAEALQRLARLMERLDLLQKGLLEQRAKLGKSLVRRVPVTWMGVASEVSGAAGLG